MSSCTFFKCCALALALLVLAGELSAAPSYPDYDNLRDLYERLLRSEAFSDRLSHQVVRKGGRDPSLRLRFGRRADPAWQSLVSAENEVDN